MSELNAEEFAQLAFDRNLLDVQQVESLWAEFGTRHVPASEFSNLVLRRGLLTNYQIEKLKRGERQGFYYGKYKVLYLVGTGTFARVYRAVHSETNRVVAIKVLRKRFCDIPLQREQFIREGKVGTTLRHPNIVPIYEEVYQRPLPPYLVMEFVEGNNLRQFVRMRGKLSPEVSLGLTRDIASGLSYAFEKGIHHRDLKMSNVLVSSRGTAKLVDFGLAALRGQDTDEALVAHPNPRTIDYAALERVTGVRKDHPQSDIFFVGAMMYRMLGGEPALQETKDRIQRLSVTRFQEIMPLEELAPELPHDVVFIVNRAMDLNPTHRFATPGEMLVEVKLAIRRLNNPLLDGEEQTGGEEQNEEAAAPKTQTIMVVENSVAMQDMMREQLKKQGYRVLVIGDPSRALDRFAESDPQVESSPQVDCVVFSAHNLGDRALKAFCRFAASENTASVPAVILLNPKQDSHREQLPLDTRHAAVSMPIRMKEFRDVLETVMGNEDAS